MALLLGAQPAVADTPNAAVCVVIGTVDVSPGVGSLPPASASAGNYTFHDLQLICVGTQAGDAGVQSAGGTGLNCGAEVGILLGSFCGPYTASDFETGAIGNEDCTGLIGGPQLVFGGGAPPGRWSLTFGPLITGSIVDHACDAPAPVVDVGFDDGNGVFVAVAEPDPTTANILGGGPVGCAAPTPGPAGPAVLYFCGIILEGVAVIVE